MQKGAVNTFTTPFSVCDSLAWIRTKTKRIKISCATFTPRDHTDVAQSADALRRALYHKTQILASLK